MNIFLFQNVKKFSLLFVWSVSNEKSNLLYSNRSANTAICLGRSIGPFRDPPFLWPNWFINKNLPDISFYSFKITEKIYKSLLTWIKSYNYNHNNLCARFHFLYLFYTFLLQYYDIQKWWKEDHLLQALTSYFKFNFLLNQMVLLISNKTLNQGLYYYHS